RWHRRSRAIARLRRRPARDCTTRAVNKGSTMRVPILKQRDYLIASIQAVLSDEDLLRLRDELAEQVGRYRSRGVIIDVTVQDLIDSFATRLLRDIAL